MTLPRSYQVSFPRREEGDEVTLARFVKEHREEIDKIVHSVCRGVVMNDAVRKEWVMNYEALYVMAKMAGWRG